MAKKSTGLGKGLDSLIPDFYDEDFDSNSAVSLEDMLSEDEKQEESSEDIVDDENIQETIVEEDESSENQQIDTVEDDTDEDINQEEAENIETSSEDLPGSESDEESIQDQKEQEKILENVAEVKEIVDKNPRITLWSSQSAAVFRYLRKTEPEFSISKEASVLIDEAVSKKYPEIWELFEDI